MSHLNKGLKAQYGTDWEDVKEDLTDEFNELISTDDMDIDSIEDLFGDYGLDPDAIEDMIYEFF